MNKLSFIPFMNTDQRELYKEWLIKHEVLNSGKDYFNTIHAIEKYSKVDINTFLENGIDKAIEKLKEFPYSKSSLSQMGSRLRKYWEFLNS